MHIGTNIIVQCWYLYKLSVKIGDEIGKTFKFGHWRISNMFSIQPQAKVGILTGNIHDPTHMNNNNDNNDNDNDK